MFGPEGERRDTQGAGRGGNEDVVLEVAAGYSFRLLFRWLGRLLRALFARLSSARNLSSLKNRQRRFFTDDPTSDRR